MRIRLRKVTSLSHDPVFLFKLPPPTPANYLLGIGSYGRLEPNPHAVWKVPPAGCSGPVPHPSAAVSMATEPACPPRDPANALKDQGRVMDTRAVEQKGAVWGKGTRASGIGDSVFWEGHNGVFAGRGGETWRPEWKSQVSVAASGTSDVNNLALASNQLFDWFILSTKVYRVTAVCQTLLVVVA